MPLHIGNGLTRSLTGAAFASVALLAATASASVLPWNTNLTIELDGNTIYNNVEVGSDIGPDLYQFTGGTAGLGYDITWDYTANPDPGSLDGAYIGNGFTFMNESASTQVYRVWLTLPLEAGAAAPVNYGGSAGFGLTGIDGTLSSLTGSPMWSGQIDGVTVSTLFDDPTSISFVGPGSDDLSDSTFGGNGPVLNTIGIVLEFSLSAGDTVTTTGVFGVIPAPSALAIFAVGLFGRRRRN